MRYYIKQKVFSIKDKFKVTDENQNDLYEVRGKFMSISNKLELKDMQGNLLYLAKKKKFYHSWLDILCLTNKEMKLRSLKESLV